MIPKAVSNLQILDAITRCLEEITRKPMKGLPSEARGRNVLGVWASFHYPALGTDHDSDPDTLRSIIADLAEYARECTEGDAPFVLRGENGGRLGNRSKRPGPVLRVKGTMTVEDRLETHRDWVSRGRPSNEQGGTITERIDRAQAEAIERAKADPESAHMFMDFPDPDIPF
ncbi:MAG: hypothetical protein HRU00_12415 [Myxococcales bacterium]|nr:hypothetical protein [Myxococcales bacterium]